LPHFDKAVTNIDVITESIFRVGSQYHVIAEAVFYIFACILIFSSLLVITARNPVHSVLFLILCFFNAAGLFVLLGAEFIGMILAIVYVGAVAVLFLFVVMMLDVDFVGLRKGAMQYVPLGLVVGGVLLVELGFLYFAWKPAEGASLTLAAEITGEEKSNTHAIGSIIYTQYILPFQVSGLVLLVSMIGAITLTLRHRPGVRRQNISKQIKTQPQDAVELVKVETGAGV
jgi:NADH-quinone oxidoreductase subunit J